MRASGGLCLLQRLRGPSIGLSFQSLRGYGPARNRCLTEPMTEEFHRILRLPPCVFAEVAVAPGIGFGEYGAG